MRSLEVEANDFKAKLIEHGAVDLGEEHLREHIIYNSDLSWRDERKFLRLRQNRKGNVLTYKHKIEQHSIDAHAIEVVVDDQDQDEKKGERMWKSWKSLGCCWAWGFERMTCPLRPLQALSV